MTLTEIKAKAKKTYEQADEINSIAEAQEAVRNVCAMVYHLTDHVQKQAGKEGG